MVDWNKALSTTRFAVFGLVCGLSVVDFVIACHIMAVANDYTSHYLTLAGLGLAAAFLSLLTLPFMLWLVSPRKGLFAFFVVTELAWCTFLWIMWISTAGASTCINNRHSSLAKEAKAFEAFAFINFFALLFYTAMLCCVSIILHMKGISVIWTSSVKDFDFNTALDQHAIPDSPVVPQGEKPHNPPQQPNDQQQPLAPQAGYAPQGTYNPYQQPPVAVV